MEEKDLGCGMILAVKGGDMGYEWVKSCNEYNRKELGKIIMSKEVREIMEKSGLVEVAIETSKKDKDKKEG